MITKCHLYEGDYPTLRNNSIRGLANHSPHLHAPDVLIQPIGYFGHFSEGLTTLCAKHRKIP
jgi:hypothetical protein